ncbi:unnamed protein product [Leptosia nina]|uniref:Uncharacterized protein n=1 Tax=Leptosia nina TaxID=320188 RepID=A0AAV1IVG4_9NEOP
MVTAKVYTKLLLCFLFDNVFALTFPGPRVYVVTPAAPRPFQRNHDNQAPFYYQNWMRRMDSDENITSTTTTASPKVKTPDLIFAEFDKDATMKKSIRKLLEQERIPIKTPSTTVQPIYVADEKTKAPGVNNYGLPLSSVVKDNEENHNTNFQTDYVSMYNDLYNAPVPVYKPTTTTTTTTQPPPAEPATSTTTENPINVENIWHIIDSEKLNQYSGNWDEAPVPSHEYTSDDTNNGEDGVSDDIQTKDLEDTNPSQNNKEEEAPVGDNFALPGFASNPGNGAENESRAIRTEQNIRFPYVNLKPFQMKNLKKPMLDLLTSSKKGNNLYTNLDNFFDTKNPDKGEAQDVSAYAMNQPIDRYNPAQPYLPQAYSSKSKQTNSSPPKATASLVPPPPPPVKGNNFPSPISYESFPPYAPSAPGFIQSPSFPPSPSLPPSSAPAPAPAPMQPPPVILPPNDTPIDTYSGPSVDDDGPPDVVYRYNRPTPPPTPQFLPTIAPISPPLKGYSYDKPPMSDDGMSMDNSQDFKGYQYNKPPQSAPSPPDTYDFPSSHDSSGPSYGPSDSIPDHHDSDYADMPFQKNPGHAYGDDTKDAGMMPPPDKPDLYGAPPDHDFPGDFKFPLGFDHHHPYLEHHEHTTTTEMPRVNRFSYYYLGKKLYYLPLYFSVYFIVYVGALIIKAVLRHKIVYPNSWRPNTTTATFFSKRSIDDFLSHDNMHELTGRVTHAIATAAEKYMKGKRKLE